MKFYHTYVLFTLTCILVSNLHSSSALTTSLRQTTPALSTIVSAFTESTSNINPRFSTFNPSNLPEVTNQQDALPNLTCKNNYATVPKNLDKQPVNNPFMSQLKKMKFSLPGYEQKRNLNIIKQPEFYLYLEKNNVFYNEFYNQQELEKISQAFYNTNLKSTAIHEASHAYFIINSLYNLITAASITPQRGFLGIVLHEPLFYCENKKYPLQSLSLDNKKKYIDERVQISLSGIVGQQILDSNFKYYSPNKMLESNDIINLCGDYIETEPLSNNIKDNQMIITNKSYKGDLANIEILAYHSLEPHQQNPINNELINQKFIELILQHYPSIFQKIISNKEQILKIANLLLKKGTVSGEEIYNIIDMKYPLKNRYNFDESHRFIENKGTHDVYGTPKLQVIKNTQKEEAVLHNNIHKFTTADYKIFPIIQ